MKLLKNPTLASAALASTLMLGLTLPHVTTAHADDDKPVLQKPVANPKLDRSGKSRKGEASYYHDRFAGQTMADGTPMNPGSNNAASKSLPLGTKAKVTNLENGKSAVVEIRDRGPYVEGRIVDVSPRTARKLGMQEDGVVPVEVAPIEVPLPDGRVKPGEAAR